jgi:hypothetical protein
MQDRDPNPPDSDEHQKTPPSEPQQSLLEPAGEVVVQHYSTPPRTQPPLKIHSRRPLPSVPLSSQLEDADSKEKSK